MKIGIHKSERRGYFSERWIPYCEENDIPFKLVNCYDSDIMGQLADCDALMWHISHADARDFLFARQLIAAVEAAGKLTFPNSNACWHFDDKVGQKYLLEAVGAPLAPAYVFYSKTKALEWAEKTTYPKVFKLRGGSSSANVRLVKRKVDAYRLINRAFGNGFRAFDRLSMFKDAFRKTVSGKLGVLDLAKAGGKVFVHSDFEKVRGRESGYVYFQEFYPDNAYDIRVVVIGKKAFAIKRIARDDDFRASGSGMIVYDKDQLDVRCVEIAFEITGLIGANCLSFDFVYDKNNSPAVLEISFGFSQAGYDDCQGYWDRDLQWHPGRFRQQNWMVDETIDRLSQPINE
jgi:glutathione synthase/RimK-type ligase-like ATP-grasp enzyme